MSDALVSLEGVRRVYGGRAVLDGIDLAFGRGTRLAVLGASGSGKTTLLRLLAGFDRAAAGTIRIDGAVVDGAARFVPAERRGIGYVAQEGALFPHLTVAANVLFGLPRAERRDTARAARLLARVGLADRHLGSVPATLSGGEQQRVALARALAREPALVLLDEPFSALDASLRADTRAAVLAALGDAGAAAVLVTHDQAEALSCGDRVAVLRDGRLAQVDHPAALYARPADPALARFVGEATLWRTEARDGWVASPLGPLPLAVALPDGPALAMLRPEQVVLVPPEEAGGHDALVEALTFLGADASLRLRVGAETVLARVAGHRRPERGAVVRVAASGPAMGWRDAGEGLGPGARTPAGPWPSDG